MTGGLIYRPRHQRQRLRDRTGALIGCTDTCLAMLVDASTFGGLIGVTELLVRQLSDERVPDPESPGLNLRQVVAVARQLRVPLYDRTGERPTELLTYLDRNQRVIAQIWYPALGGAEIGHAVLIQARRPRSGAMQMLINDPIKPTAEWRDEQDVIGAMRQWADRTDVPPPGLRFAVSRPLPYLAR